jgi:hypothetical protein
MSDCRTNQAHGNNVELTAGRLVEFSMQLQEIEMPGLSRD